MSETNNPEINVEELMGKMREEVAQRRAGNSLSTPQLSPAEISAAAIDWPRMNASLDVAEHHAQVGSFVPGWTRLGRLRRRLARLTARFVLYLSGFVTHQQRQFNSAVLQSLYTLSDGLRNLESRLQSGFAGRDVRIDGLEAAMRGVQESVTVVERAQHEHLNRLESGLVERDARIGGLQAHVERWGAERDQRMDEMAAALHGAEEGIRGLQAHVEQWGAERDRHMDEMAAALHGTDEGIRGLQAHVEQWGAERDQRMDGIDEGIRGLQAHVEQWGAERDQRLDVIEENMRNTQVEQEDVRRRVGLFGLRVRELEEKEERLTESLKVLQGAMGELGARFEQGQEEVRQKEEVLVRRLEEEGERLTEGARGFTAEMEALLQRHRELFHRYEELRQENILQKRRLDLVLSELRKKAGLERDAVQTIAAQGERLLDHTYLLFENRFRGPQEDTRRKQEIYLPVFQSYLHAGAPLLKNAGFVLDLGCGRGEMLEILREAGIPARGVDVNEDMIHICRQKGLEAIQDDFFHYLASLPDESLAGAISCQVIEHLSARQNIELLKLLFDKLGWGAKLILETVNPENLLVSSLTFYEDLSHRLKLPAVSLSFLAECLGFTILETRYLAPYPEEERFQLLANNGDPVAEKVNENLRRLNTLFFGPRDYALICRKGGE